MCFLQIILFLCEMEIKKEEGIMVIPQIPTVSLAPRKKRKVVVKPTCGSLAKKLCFFEKNNGEAAGPTVFNLLLSSQVYFVS